MTFLLLAALRPKLVWGTLAVFFVFLMLCGFVGDQPVPVSQPAAHATKRVVRKHRVRTHQPAFVTTSQNANHEAASLRDSAAQ